MLWERIGLREGRRGDNFGPKNKVINKVKIKNKKRFPPKISILRDML